MHGVMCIGKWVNVKVRNYDLRDLDTEINKLSGWNLAPLRK